MNEPIRTQWQIRCAFNGFCKLALKREAMNAHRDTKQRQLREVTFSDLSPLEEKQLYVCDEYFADDEAEQSFVVGGKEITAKLLAEALHSLPEEKRETVLLYYFFDMSEREIAKFCNLSRTTVQSRRTSSMKLLKRYLEEKAYDCAQISKSEQDERGLLPYPVIIAATKGDPEAMNIVVQHYESYIASLSMRKLRDERGNIYWGIDEDIRDRLRSRLMRAVLSFKV